MHNFRCQFVFVLLFLFVLLEKAKALRCYTCSSLATLECNDPFDIQQFTLQNDCEYNEVCVKHRTQETYMAPAELKRGCVNEDYCSYGGYTEYCETCTGELCNSSLKIVPSFAVFVLILACNTLL